MEQAPVRIEVRAPADVRMGEVFQARIEIEASLPLRDLAFSIVYDKSRRSLVGRSEGAFVQRATSSEFGVDEPSDGYIEVVFRAVNGSAAMGSGSIAVFEFEADPAGNIGHRACEREEHRRRWRSESERPRDARAHHDSLTKQNRDPHEEVPVTVSNGIPATACKTDRLPIADRMPFTMNCLNCDLAGKDRAVPERVPS